MNYLEFCTLFISNLLKASSEPSSRSYSPLKCKLSASRSCRRSVRLSELLAISDWRTRCCGPKLTRQFLASPVLIWASRLYTQWAENSTAAYRSSKTISISSCSLYTWLSSCSTRCGSRPYALYWNTRAGCWPARCCISSKFSRPGGRSSSPFYLDSLVCCSTGIWHVLASLKSRAWTPSAGFSKRIYPKLISENEEPRWKKDLLVEVKNVRVVLLHFELFGDQVRLVLLVSPVLPSIHSFIRFGLEFGTFSRCGIRVFFPARLGRSSVPPQESSLRLNQSLIYEARVWIFAVFLFKCF